MNTQSLSRYSGAAILIHWLTALLIFVAFPLGKYMHDLPLSPQKLELFSYHKWLGITVLLLFLPRLLVRIAKPPPTALPAPAWQHRAASLTHALLYLLILLVPLSGWYLSLVPLPDLVDKNKELGSLLKEFHEALSTGLFVLVALHLAAAIKHHVIDKDGTLRRMLPGRNT